MTHPQAPPFVPYSEPLRATLLRTGLIACGIATVTIIRSGALSPFPFGLWATLFVCALWFSFGGHWIELWFLHVLRPRLSRARAVQIPARLAVWFLGGIVLMTGMRGTWWLLWGAPAPWSSPWWQDGFSFIVVELIVHATLLQATGRPSFYNGKG